MRLSRRSRSARYCFSVMSLQCRPSSPDGDRAQQQSLERGAEGGIAAFDGIGRIAQQMRQAHLPFDGVATLAAQHVGHPDHRPDLAEQGLNHGLAAAGADHVQHGQAADEHPFPPVLAAHPRGGLIGTHHRTGEHRRADRCRCRQQWFTRAGQHVADRTLAEGEREDLVHQRGQPFHADGVRVVQVDHQGGDRLTERRTGFQPRRRGGGHTLAAAGAATAEQAHLRHVRLDRWQFDAFVNLLRGLRGLRECRLALRTGGQNGVDDTIRVRMQCPPEPGAALARRLVARGTIRLLPFRRRQRGIVRRLGRTLERSKPLLKFTDAGHSRLPTARPATG